MISYVASWRLASSATLKMSFTMYPFYVDAFWARDRQMCGQSRLDRTQKNGASKPRRSSRPRQGASQNERWSDAPCGACGPRFCDSWVFRPKLAVCEETWPLRELRDVAAAASSAAGDRLAALLRHVHGPAQRQADRSSLARRKAGRQKAQGRNRGPPCSRSCGLGWRGGGQPVGRGLRNAAALARRRVLLVFPVAGGLPPKNSVR